MNPTLAARSIREESIASRPKVGSTSLQRQGADPLYHVGPDGPIGVISAQQKPENRGFSPTASWDSFFTPFAKTGSHILPTASPATSATPTHMPTPTGMPSNTVPHAAPPPGTLGANPVVPNTQGPPVAIPWHPNNPGQTEFQPDPALAALRTSGQTGQTPYGPVSVRTASPTPISLVPDWNQLRDTTPAESVPNGSPYSLPLSAASAVSQSQSMASSGKPPRRPDEAQPATDAPQMDAFS